jgi:hypothetical protein
VVHDPELDEAVIAFANADFAAMRASAAAPDQPGGARAACRDLAGAVRPVPRHRPAAASFESLALEYAQQFGWSAPQWYSLPKLVADAAADERPAHRRRRAA